MKRALVILSILAMTGTAFAGECVLSVTREACPGKEKESYKKCDGKESCDETKKAADAAECAKVAVDECKNVGARQKVTKLKKITAKFDGAAVEGGKNFCDAARPDFNKCAN